MLGPNTPAAKISALGLLGIALLAGNQFILQPLLGTYHGNNQTITQSDELLQRYRALVAEQPVLKERLAALESEDAASAAYLESTSDALAGAELQDFATEAIEISGGEIISVQSLEAVDIEDGPALRKVAVNLSFSTDIDGLAKTLYDLESGEPMFFIESLQISAEGDRQQKGEQKLDVHLEVFGFMRRPG